MKKVQLSGYENMDLDIALHKINHRKWLDLRSKWLSYIPIIKPPGSYDFTTVEEFLTSSNIGNILSRSEDEFLESEIMGLRQLVFREAIFLLHKASHVIGAAEYYATIGIQTWSLSNAYQGALFGALSILNFLGINYSTYKRKGIICNIWPVLRIRNKAKMRNLPVREDISEFFLVDKRVEHQFIWQTFQRLLNVSKVNEWPSIYVKSLCKLNLNEFSWQRNHLHYRNNTWICSDMFDFVINDEFGSSHNDLLKALDFSKEKKDFSLILAIVILRLAIILMENLCELSNKLKEEKSIVSDFLCDINRHPIYLKSYAGTQA